MTLDLGILNNVLSVDLNDNGIFSGQGKAKSKKERYLSLMRGINIISYSTLSNLHLCERRFACSKLRLAASQDSPKILWADSNIDFAFGRSVESGVHGVLVGNKDQDIFKEQFLSWDIPLFEEHARGYAKTFTDSVIAIDRFKYVKQMLFGGWEIAFFNGKPAIEVAMCIDCGNGYYYIGHADVILYNPIERRYRVLEIKTTGAKYFHEAMYKNSDQAIGYSIMLDNIAKDLEETATFEVFYLVYATSFGEWKKFDFSKSRSQRAGWINTILLDIQRINTYLQVDYWPKRGSSCMSYGKPCSYFDTCDLSKEAFNPNGFEMVTEEEILTYDFDFHFNLQDIINTQKDLIS